MQPPSTDSLSGMLTVSSDVVGLSSEFAKFRGLRVRCGELPRFERCGWTLARWQLGDTGELTWDDHFEPANMRMSPMLQPGGVTRGRLTVREPGVFYGAARRIQVVCKCGAHHVLKLDELVPVLEDRVRAGEVKSNGWIDVHTGEL